jgi:hypothetical protein
MLQYQGTGEKDGSHFSQAYFNETGKSAQAFYKKKLLDNL